MDYNLRIGPSELTRSKDTQRLTTLVNDMSVDLSKDR